MKIILRSDVEGVGRRGDVLDVAAGFARNYLVPKGLAMKATPAAEAQAETTRRTRALRHAADRADAEEVATRLVPTVITIGARTGDGGRLFGSIGAGDIVDAVMAQTGIAIDRKQLRLETPIKELGSHMIMTRLHPEVEFPVTIDIVAE